MKLWLKALISVALIAVLCWQIDLAELQSAFAPADLRLWLLAFVLFIGQQVLVAYCWQMLLEAENQRVPFRKTLEVHFVGSFFGTFLPSSVGMDILRVYQLGRYLRRGVDAASTMFVARVVGFLINFVLALAVALPVSRALGDARLFWAVLAGTLAFAAALVIMLHAFSLRVLRHVLQRFKLDGLAEKLTEFRGGILALFKKRGAAGALIVLSFLYQALGILIIYLIGVALQIELALWHYFIYIPLITTITVLPISLAGIGLRENAFVFFFALAGVAASQSLSLSLMVFAQTLGLALLGGIWYFFARDNRQALEVSEEPQKLSA